MINPIAEDVDAFCTANWTPELMHALLDCVSGAKCKETTKPHALQWKLEEWSEQPAWICPCDFPTSVGSEESCKGNGCQGHPKCKKAVVLTAINNHLKNDGTEAIDSSLTETTTETDDDETSLILSLQDKVLPLLLRQWFMKLLKGKANKHCCLGHDAEGLLLSNLLKEFKRQSKLAALKLQLHEVCLADLVHKKGIKLPWMHCRSAVAATDKKDYCASWVQSLSDECNRCFAGSWSETSLEQVSSTMHRGVWLCPFCVNLQGARSWAAPSHCWRGEMERATAAASHHSLLWCFNWHTDCWGSKGYHFLCGVHPIQWETN